MYLLIMCTFLQFYLRGVIGIVVNVGVDPARQIAFDCLYNASLATFVHYSRLVSCPLMEAHNGIVLPMT